MLLQRLAALARFRPVPRLCTRAIPGIDEVPEWQVWTNRDTTLDQPRIEEELEKIVNRSVSILHVVFFISQGCWYFSRSPEG
jgi:hypothetical protein